MLFTSIPPARMPVEVSEQLTRSEMSSPISSSRVKSWGEGIARRSDACLESIAHRKRKIPVVRRNWRGKPLVVGFRELARGHFRLQHAVDKRLELGVILSKHQTEIEVASIDVRQKAKRSEEHTSELQSPC